MEGAKDGVKSGGCDRFPGVKSPSRRLRLTAALSAAVALILVAAPAAMAENGVGLAGPTDDKTVTFFCFGVIAFFTILVIGLSLLQGKLEKRKARRRADLERFS
jgi:hypothetical protein